MVPAAQQQQVQRAVFADRADEFGPARLVEVVRVDQGVDRCQHRSVAGLGPARV
ncbi:MAG TPA: hypothetical protein VLP43_12465 [Solirubrobacteraceae bacterium]|nr:hypothetical protein [Solirubrobacteraceae bacterium]